MNGCWPGVKICTVVARSHHQARAGYGGCKLFARHDIHGSAPASILEMVANLKRGDAWEATMDDLTISLPHAAQTL